MRLTSLLILVLAVIAAPAHADLRERRPALRAAFDAADAGRLVASPAAAVADHPL